MHNLKNLFIRTIYRFYNFGPIRDTIKSTTGVAKMKKNSCKPCIPATLNQNQSNLFKKGTLGQFDSDSDFSFCTKPMDLETVPWTPV